MDCYCDDWTCAKCEAAQADRAAHEASGWERLEDWGRLVLVPGTRIVECKPSADGKAIFYRTAK